MNGGREGRIERRVAKEALQKQSFALSLPFRKREEKAKRADGASPGKPEPPGSNRLFLASPPVRQHLVTVAIKQKDTGLAWALLRRVVRRSSVFFWWWLWD